MAEETVEQAALRERVLVALTTGMVGAAGEPLTTTVDESARPGTGRVEYYLGPALLGHYAFEVDRRSPEVSLHVFRGEKFEYRNNAYRNALVIHERLLANLAGTACVLRTAVTDGQAVWTPHYDWDPAYRPFNEQNLRSAIEQIGEAVRGQTAWDASDLVERALLIGGADPDLGTGAGSWRHLLHASTPGSLHEGLDAIQPGLGHAVFDRVSCWYGQRTLTGPA